MSDKGPWMPDRCIRCGASLSHGDDRPTEIATVQRAPGIREIGLAHVDCSQSDRDGGGRGMSPGQRWSLMRWALVQLRRVARRYTINIDNAYESSAKAEGLRSDEGQVAA